MAAVLLGAGTRLLHIGPHKTGTTAVQGAFHIGRERLGTEGVFYPGQGRQPLWPILAITGQPALLGEPEPEISYWDRLVPVEAAVRAAPRDLLLGQPGPRRPRGRRPARGAEQRVLRRGG